MEAKRTAAAAWRIAEARKRANCLYYMQKLLLLFDTPEAPPGGGSSEAGSVAEMNRARVKTAVDEETARLATPEAKKEIGLQEGIADDPNRVWTTRTGKNGKKFLVDRSDPKNIVVRVKVRLIAAGGSNDTDIANLVFLEDAVERVADTTGYTVDVIFTRVDGDDVFTIASDVGKWPTSGNIVGNARTIAHEIHHLLGLDDRYDYIESHAGNKNMLIPDRLHWFREQMKRGPDPQASKSLMGSGKTVLDDDACRVAGLDLATCQAARAGKAP